MRGIIPKRNRLNENELFSVCEFTPNTFNQLTTAYHCYMLTLIIYENDECQLTLTFPGISPLLPSNNHIRQIISIVFSDFLVEMFRKKGFLLIGELLNKSSKGTVFSQSIALQLKDEITGLADVQSFESNIRFLYIMKNLSESSGKRSLSSEDIFREVDSLQASGKNNKINKAKDYILENYRKDIKLKDVAVSAGLSEYELSRLFKEMTGQNFSAYLTGIRIENTICLLLETDDTIEGIAYSCGFNSPYYFNEVFKKKKGLTPGRFRSQSGSPTVDVVNCGFSKHELRL